MEALKDKIRIEGNALSETILKVDCFLNQQIDVDFMLKMGKEFANRFEGEEITKIVTIEASGIAPAMAAAMELKVPVVFAKKKKAVTMGDDVYCASVRSFTRGTTYNISVGKEFINKEDRVLVIDDFLAYGNALIGLHEIVKESGACFVGAGIVIEKGFQKGSDKLKEMGIRVESLAVIEKMDKGFIKFK